MYKYKIYVYLFTYIQIFTHTYVKYIGRCEDETWKRQMSKGCFKNDF